MEDAREVAVDDGWDEAEETTDVLERAVGRVENDDAIITEGAEEEGEETRVDAEAADARNNCI